MAAGIDDETNRAIDEVVRIAALHAEQHDRAGTFPIEAFQALRAARLMSLLVPTEFGGLGGSLLDVVDVARRLASQCLSLGMIWVMHCQQVDAIDRHGGGQFRIDLLRDIASSQLYLGSITTEPVKAGNSVLSTSSPLRRVTGDASTDSAELVVDRFAPIVTGGLHADGFLVTMRDSDLSAEERSTLVYVGRSQATIERIGPPWDPMGMRATESVGLHINAQISADQVLGDRGGFRAVALDSVVPLAHIGWSACWVGAVLGAVHAALKSRSLKTSEVAREQFARARMLVELVDCYVHAAAVLVDTYRGRRASLDNPTVQVQLNLLKVAAADMMPAAIDLLVEIAGLKHGYLRGQLERTSRDLRAAPLNISNAALLARTGNLTLLDRGVQTLGNSLFLGRGGRKSHD